MIVQLGVIITGIIVFITLLIFIYYEENFEEETASQTLSAIKQSYQETKNHYLNAKRLHVSGQLPFVEITNTDAAAQDTQTHFQTLQTETIDASMLREGNKYVMEARQLANKAKANFSYLNN